MSGRIAPDSTGFYGIDRRLGNTKVCRNVSLPFTVRDTISDRPNLINGQDRAAVAFSLGAASGMCPGPLPMPGGSTPLTHHIGHVLGLSADEQMVAAHAKPVVAMMKNKEAVRNRPYLNFVCNAVRGNELIAGKRQEPVPSRFDADARPEPAVARFVDSGPKSFSGDGGNMSGHWEVPFLVSPPRNLAVRGGISASILPSCNTEMRR